MANDLSKATPLILAQGLQALREVAVVPQLVNRKYDAMAGEKGSTIDVPIPSAIAVQQVTPANVPPSTADVAPTMVPIVMSQWWEAPFYLTDKDLLEVQDGYFPVQASEAIKALANKVNVDLLGCYRDFYGTGGAAGTTPFASDLTEATNVRLALNKQLAPMDDRRLLIDPSAEAKALLLAQISNQQWRGNQNNSAIVAGMIAKTLGFDWYMHQLIWSHTPGTAVSATVTTAVLNAVGASTVTLKVSASTATLVYGDIITFAGLTQNFVVTGNVTLTTAGVATGIYPALGAAVDGSGTPVAVTVKAAHVANIAMHRDAIAFATRPLQNVEAGLGAITQSAVDPDSGLTLRLEITREHKRTRYSFDMLYGYATIRPQLGARLLG